MKNKPHQGKILSDHLHTKGVKVGEFAHEVGCTRQTAHRWFKQEELELKVLKRIYGHFGITSKLFNPIKPLTKSESEHIKSEIARLEKIITDLQNVFKKHQIK